MPDVSISELPVASEMTDNALAVVLQNNETRSIAGSLIKSYASNAGEAAALSVAAQSAASAVETRMNTMTTAAETLTPGSDVTVDYDPDANTLAFGIPAGEKGETGDRGETGATGAAATIAVGTVTTGAPGTQAIVTNVGTPGAAVFNFTIPRGQKGDSGSGTGDMLKSVYDDNNAVASAGGIAAYVSANGGKVETVNNKGVDSGTKNITLNASDVGARPNTWTPSAADVGAIANPSSKANGQVLTYNGSAWTAQTPSAGMTATTYTTTIPSSSWTSSGGYYSKTVTVTGLKATYPVPPVVDCSLSGSDSAGDEAVIEAFKSLAIITTAANSITVKAIGAKPGVNIPITISVWE